VDEADQVGVTEMVYSTVQPLLFLRLLDSNPFPWNIYFVL